MCPNPRIPMDPEMVKRLLVEMRQYRGERGIYAAEMLKAARFLLEQPEQHPRQAETAAYCIRQAVKEVFGDTRDRNLLPELVKRAVKAKNSIQTADAVVEADLQSMYQVVDDLEDFVCSSKPEVRLKKLFRKSSGIEPVDGRHSLVKEYRRVLGKRGSNSLMHHVSATPIGMDKVHDHYEDVVDVLTMIFLPTERLARIERLAELPAPQKSDLDELRRIMKNAYGFDHFASKMSSPDWFDMMESDMLKSPSGNPPWMLRSLAWHLKDEHVGAFVKMLDRHFNRWASDEAGLAELGFVAYKLGDCGLPWLVKTLQVSEKTRIKYDRKVKERLKVNQPDAKLIEEIERMGDSIWHLDDYARRAFLKIKQPSSEFVELAEHLLGSAPTVNAYYKTTAIPAKLVEVMDSSYSIQTVKILAKELGTHQDLQYWAIYKPVSVARMSPDSPHKIDNAVGNLHGALEKAGDLGISTPELIGALVTLPDAIKPRFVAWLYSRADDIDRLELADFVVGSCSSRPPTDDDDLLLDRLEHDGGISNDLATRIRSVIGKAPELAKMVGRPSQWDLDTEERRCIMWARTMSHRVELPDEWKPCLDIVDGFYEAKRGSDGGQAQKAPETQDDATLLGGYGTDVPLEVATKIAAEEPGIGGFLNLMDGRSLVSDLETVVRNNVSGWIEDPAAIIQALRRPEYVAGYLRGLGGAKDVLASHADKIIFAVKFVRSLQWGGDASGSTTFYHDGKLTSVDMVGMGLIKEVVNNDIGLSKDSLEDVWSVVTDAIICPDPETDEPPDCSIEYLRTVDSLPHVQAVNTLFAVIRYAKRNDGEVPKMALTRLTEAIRLTGRYGVDYHACIGPEALLMHWLDPDWFEQNEQYLFGRAASAELGRVALDMHLELYQPANFVLVKYRNMVLDAVKRDVHMALRHLLGCLLYGTRGYDPEYVAKSLMEFGPDYVSKTGRYMPKLLPEDVNADLVQRGIAFWDSVLKHSPKPKPEALAGFGWWADVPGIDQEQWEEMMLPTCGMAEKLDRSQSVAKRISSSQTITDAGWKILAQLFSIDIGYEEGVVAEHAMEALRKTVGIADAPDSRSHLREVLVNRGFHGAAEF